MYFLSPIHFKKTAFILILLLTFMVSACDEKSGQEQNSAEQHIKLNEQNINAYAHEMAQQYQSILAQLLAAFHQAKKADDSYSFIQYRNHKWTPNYIEMKEKYAQVYADNKAFLQQHPAAPLFAAFDSLIYTGIELKRSLLNNDEARQQRALDTAEKGSQRVKDTIQLLDNRAKK